jgi:NADH dehydrogenase
MHPSSGSRLEGRSPRVVIVGGGFAGLHAAKALARAPVDITLVDRRNYHLFQPLLYQVASAALSPSDIAAPIRRILRDQRNVRVLLGDVLGVDVRSRRILLDGGELPFDFAILATGSTHSYRGRDEWARDAPGLKTVEDAIEIRRRVLRAYEMAEREEDPARRRAWLTFVIVGGGPTGVEMAGALAEISRFTLARDFHGIDATEARVILVEGGARLLAGYPDTLSANARRQLERLAVHVWTGARITGVDANGVALGNERIAARTVIWAAGVAPSPLARSLGVPLDALGRVPVLADLSVLGHPELFVVGDLAAVGDGRGGGVPAVAAAAIQEGRHAASSIMRTMRGKRRAVFRYKNRGMLTTVGRAAAVAAFGRVRLSGFPAWVAWLFVHLIFLIGFRKRHVRPRCAAHHEREASVRVAGRAHGRDVAAR